MSISPTVQKILSVMTSQQIATALQSVNNGATNSAGAKVTKPAKSKRKNNAVSTQLPKTTRPLNSWMAYRNYNSTIFLTLQQKEISGLMKHMWEADPFKAKWAILAKAYSIIRDDQGKHNAPLDEFLAINTPVIEIIKSTQYLTTLGWNVALDEEGQTVIQLGSNTIDQRSLTSNVSVNDLILHSYREAYFTGNLLNVLVPDGGSSMTMATTSQQNHGTGRNTIKPTGVGMAGQSNSRNNGTTNMSATSGAVGHPTNNHAVNGANVGRVSAANNAVGNGSANSAAGCTATSHHSGNHGAGSSPVASTSTHDSPKSDGGHSNSSPASNLGASKKQEEATGSVPVTKVEKLTRSDFASCEDYPFYATFDPDSPPFTFDPFMGNQFDAFDMSDGWTDS